jgi:predicted RNase H-like HicB family nuclease
MNKKTLKYTVVKDGDFFVAKAIEIELASQGETRKQAIKNLHEAYELLNEK